MRSSFETYMIVWENVYGRFISQTISKLKKVSCLKFTLFCSGNYGCGLNSDDKCRDTFKHISPLLFNRFLLRGNTVPLIPTASRTVDAMPRGPVRQATSYILSTPDKIQCATAKDDQATMSDFYHALP